MVSSGIIAIIFGIVLFFLFRWASDRKDHQLHKLDRFIVAGFLTAGIALILVGGLIWIGFFKAH